MTRIPDALVPYRAVPNLIMTHPFATAPITSLVSATTFTTTLQSPWFKVATTTPGANKIAEYGVFNIGPDIDMFPNAKGDIFNRAFRYGCWITPVQRDNPTVSMYAGMEIGTINSTTPWTGSHNFPVIQLRYGGTTATLGQVELAYSDVGNTMTVVVLPAPATGFVAGGGAYFELLYDPFNQVVRAFVDGVEYGRIEGTNVPDFVFNGPAAFPTALFGGIFVTTGSSASGTVAATFAAPQLEIFNPFGDVASWVRQ